MIFDNIKRITDAKNISIRTLETEAGLANGTVGKWRTSKPTIDNLMAVAKVLGVALTDLLKEDET